MVNIKMHRGTNQIGGTITEIYTENTHIFIDFGSELTVKPEDSTDNQMIEMIKHAKCDAVLFSHYHGDHVGLLHHIPETDVRGETIKLGMGKVARDVLANIQETLAGNMQDDIEKRRYHKNLYKLFKEDSRWLDFKDGLNEENKENSVFTIGDFTITTLRVDHSAYDSYMFVIEAEGKCIVHTGDFRVHGRLGKDFFSKLSDFMKDKEVDVLLIEGTMLSRPFAPALSEEQMQEKAIEFLKNPQNKYVFLICSSTNMESLATFYNALMKVNLWRKKNKINKDNRAMYVSSYVKKQMKLFAEAEPEITGEFKKVNSFEQFEKYNPKLGMSQIEFMEQNGFVLLLGKGKDYAKYVNRFRDKKPVLIYSMWNGYVVDKNADTYDAAWGKLYYDFKKFGKVEDKLHTSGHAGKKDLEKMIKSVEPHKAIIPMHTEFKDKYYLLEGVADKVYCLEDGGIYPL